MPAKIRVLKKIRGQEEVMSLIRLAMKKNMSALLVGDTGCGKTSMVEAVAEETGSTLVRISINGATTPDELIGKYELKNGSTVFEKGPLYVAMEEGLTLVLDEVNMASGEVTSLLHPVMDDAHALTVSTNRCEVVKAHKDFRVFATMNPTEEYSGTKEMNAAFASRFGLTLYVDYPQQNDEIAILVEQGGCTVTSATVISEVAVRLRKARKEGKVYYKCSTRDCISWAKLVEDLGIENAFRVTVGNKSKSDESAVSEVISEVIKTAASIKDEHGVTTLAEIQDACLSLAREKSKFEGEKDNMRTAIIESLVGSLKS